MKGKKVMILLFVLLVLCIIFLITKQFHNDNEYSAFWSPFVAENGECQSDKDCLSYQVCFASKCMRAPKCDPKTGYLVEATEAALKCVCKKPDLVTQRLHGENCAIDVGCGVYGRVLSLDPLTCQCREGFKMSGEGRCVKMIEMDRPEEKTCEPNYILSSTTVARQFFHPDYLKQFRGSPRCLKMPCTFNALSPNEPLTGGQIVQDKGQKGKWSCLCDPEYGNFGVRLLQEDGNNVRYINGDGHNGCACIYKKEPFVKSSTSFDFYSYFYVKGINEPVNFVVFRPGDRDQLIEPFKGKKSIAILDDFEHSFDQTILRTASNIKHRQRYCVDHGLLSPFYKHLCYDAADFEKLDIKDCSSTPNEPCQDAVVAFGNDVYRDHFVCQSKKKAVVVNPMAIDYETGDRFSHGYKLNNRMGDWIVAPAPTPRTAYLPLDQDASKRLLGRKWKQNTNVKRGNIKYLRF